MQLGATEPVPGCNHVPGSVLIAIMSLLVLEMLLSLVVHKFNLFNFALDTLTLASLVAEVIVQHPERSSHTVYSHAETGAGSVEDHFRSMRVARLFRVFRLVRLVRLMKSVRESEMQSELRDRPARIGVMLLEQSTKKIMLMVRRAGGRAVAAAVLCWQLHLLLCASARVHAIGACLCERSRCVLAITGHRGRRVLCVPFGSGCD